MDLKQIGFYSLSDERAAHSCETSQMKRCEMIITEYCNFVVLTVGACVMTSMVSVLRNR